MPTLTLAALRKQIQSGTVASLYMLVGDDRAEKAAMAGAFATLVDEDLRAFNVDRFYGGEAKVDAVIESARHLPMLAPRRVVIVLDAERLLVPKREGKTAEAEQERLEAFLQEVPSHVTLVLACGVLDERRRVVKLLRQRSTIVDCGTIEDAAGAEMWVKARAASLQAPLDQGAVRALVQRAGLDIGALRAGLDRVALYALGQARITAEDVKQAVPASAEAQEDFGVAKAIWKGDAAGALRELTLALDAGAVPVLLMGQLRAAAEKLAPARIRRGIEAVFRADLALKSSAGEPRVLLERLVLELCGDSRSGGAAPRRGTW